MATKYHINYDHYNENGIIFNDNYDGCMFRGTDHRPDMSFTYQSFFYTEVFALQPNTVTINNKKRKMRLEEANECLALAKEWVQPLGQDGNPTSEQKAADVRLDRLDRLKECDWVVIKAKELGETVSQAWLNYRAALRDVPAQGGFPFNVTWPTKP
jgi:hypothetical protein